MINKDQRTFDRNLQHGIEKIPMKLIPNVGRFSFFCENWPIPVLTSCHENLINFLIYVYFWVGRN
jgi:hypothetical protein